MQRPHNPDQHVLDKIAELLFQIDTKEKPEPPVVPPQKRPPNSSGQRLFSNAKQRQEKLDNIRRDRDLDAQREIKSFRMQNKQSLKLLQKNPVRPIAERTKEIMQERQKRQLDHQRKKEEQARKKKEEEELHYASMRKESDNRRLNPEEYMKKQEEYNLKRLQHMNNLNLKNLQKLLHNNTYRPAINASSQDLLRNKSEYQDMNFLERQQYYDEQRQKHFAKLKYEVDRKVMPFQPNLTQRERSQSQRKFFAQQTTHKRSLKPDLSKGKLKQEASSEPFDVTFSTPRDTSTRKREEPPRSSPGRNRNNKTPEKKSLKRLTPSKSVSKVTTTANHKNSASPEPNFGREHPFQRTAPSPLDFLSESPHENQEQKRVRTEEFQPQPLTGNERERKLRQLIYRHRYEVLTFFKDLTRKDSNRHCHPHNQLGR